MNSVRDFNVMDGMISVLKAENPSLTSHCLFCSSKLLCIKQQTPGHTQYRKKNLVDCACVDMYLWQFLPGHLHGQSLDVLPADGQ